jgi:hypothetical protein
VGVAGERVVHDMAWAEVPLGMARGMEAVP